MRRTFVLTALMVAACDTTLPPKDVPALPEWLPPASAPAVVSGVVNGIAFADSSTARYDVNSQTTEIFANLPVPTEVRSSLWFSVDTLAAGTYDLTAMPAPDLSFRPGLLVTSGVGDVAYSAYEPVEGTLTLEAIPGTGRYVGTFDAVAVLPREASAPSSFPDTLRFEQGRLAVDGPLR